jgi:hypothetical protein
VTLTPYFPGWHRPLTYKTGFHLAEA